jgi:hypothetical protein
VSSRLNLEKYYKAYITYRGTGTVKRGRESKKRQEPEEERELDKALQLDTFYAELITQKVVPHGEYLHLKKPDNDEDGTTELYVQTQQGAVWTEVKSYEALPHLKALFAQTHLKSGSHYMGYTTNDLEATRRDWINAIEPHLFHLKYWPSVYVDGKLLSQSDYKALPFWNYSADDLTTEQKNTINSRAKLDAQTRVFPKPRPDEPSTSHTSPTKRSIKWNNSTESNNNSGSVACVVTVGCGGSATTTRQLDMDIARADRRLMIPTETLYNLYLETFPDDRIVAHRIFRNSKHIWHNAICCECKSTRVLVAIIERESTEEEYSYFGLNFVSDLSCPAFCVNCQEPFWVVLNTSLNKYITCRADNLYSFVAKFEKDVDCQVSDAREASKT